MARAQPSSLPIVGLLAAPAEATYTHHIAAIRQGLKEAGFSDGQFALESRWAEGQYDRLPALAADLIRRKVDVIMTLGGSPPVLAAKAATSTIPIVFHLGSDPVRLGLAASMNRPGGNITGVTLMTNSLDPKRLEFLLKMIPGAKSIGFLVNPANPQAEVQVQRMRDIAGRSQLHLIILNASTEGELEASFATAANNKVDALTVLPDVFFTSNSARIAALAARYRIPSIAHSPEFAKAGGLMSYGTNLSDAYRLAGNYAGRILKGEKPADLPIMEPIRFDFLINIKTARLLGLTVPPILLATADEVIE